MRYSNPRNFAAGSLRTLDSKITAQRKLEAVFFEIVGRDYITQSSEVRDLSRYGLPIISTFKYGNLIKVGKFGRHFASIMDQRFGLDFPIDGVVVKINSKDMQKELGSGSNRPWGQLAIKFPPKTEITKLVDIVYGRGETGKETVVAEFEPVVIGGVTISRASLHNSDWVENKGLKVGQHIVVMRSGDVIPQVVGAVKECKHGNG